MVRSRQGSRASRPRKGQLTDRVMAVIYTSVASLGRDRHPAETGNLPGRTPARPASPAGPAYLPQSSLAPNASVFPCISSLRRPSAAERVRPGKAPRRWSPWLERQSARLRRRAHDFCVHAREAAASIRILLRHPQGSPGTARMIPCPITAAHRTVIYNNLVSQYGHARSGRWEESR